MFALIESLSGAAGERYPVGGSMGRGGQGKKPEQMIMSIFLFNILFSQQCC